MKRPAFILFFLIIVSLSVPAQGYYFDIGGSAGLTWINVNNASNGDGFAMGLGLKFGVGPFGNVPLYAAAEGNLNFDVGDKYNTLYFGPGLMFYPHYRLQFGASVGPTWELQYVSDMGIGWNVSVAADLGKRASKYGFLLGLKYYGARNQVEYKTFDLSYFFPQEVTEKVPMQTTFLSVFVKFTRRKKTPKQSGPEYEQEERREKSNEQSASSSGDSSAAQQKAPAQTQSRSNTGINAAISRVSQDLINELPEKTSVAVINVSSTNSNLSAHVADELEFQLVSSRKFTIVDRTALDTIRREQNFQMSGEVSDSSAVSIGQMLGANIVITGSITEIDKKQRLSLKALNVRTAEIVTMVREEF